MNARDFLRLAQDLLSQPTEAAWRSAVSRAYYAAFHVAREPFDVLGFVVPKAERAHAYLWLRLSNCADADVQLAGRELNDLRGDRNQADYDFKRPLPQAVAAGQVRAAEKVIEALDTSSLEPKRAVIVEAIKTYA